MKIVTIGFSPYRLTSKSKLNALILEHLNKSHQVASIVSYHDKNFFFPRNIDGFERYFYTTPTKQNIQLYPLDKPNDCIQIYETLKKLKPDLIITIGDYLDFTCMKAVMMFLKEDNIKWLFILSNHFSPIKEDLHELIDDVDAILCTSKTSEHDVQFFTKGLETHWVGSRFQTNSVRKDDKFRISVCAKKTSSDNIPMLMEVAAKIRDQIPNLELEIHCNINDPGEHDIYLLKERFDPNDEFIKLPEKYVSNIDGISDAELSELYGRTDVFVSIPVTSATGMTVFEAMSFGCLPLMSDCGINKEIAENFPEIKEDILVRSINIMVPGESYIAIPDPEDLKRKLVNIFTISKRDKGIGTKFSEFIKEHTIDSFLEKVSEMVERTKNSVSTVCLETV